MSKKYSTKLPEESTDNLNNTEEKKITELLENSANYNEAEDTSWKTSPYPEGAILPSEQPKRPRQDPQETTVVLFPGQGTIKVGQIKEYLHFPRVNELFKVANDSLGYDLLDICLNGPQKKLNRCEYNQPATTAISLAAIEKLREERPTSISGCKSIAGYSIGEIPALIFAGGLTLEDGIRLAGVRGAAMQQACDLNKQAMISVFIKAGTNLKKICEPSIKYAESLGVTDPVCRVAIYVCPQTRIIAGHEEAIDYIEKNSRELGVTRVKRLPVSGAFHTVLMEPAVESFKNAIDNVKMNDLTLKVYSNVKGTPYLSTEEIRKLLIKQLTRPVRWEQILHHLYARPEGESFPRTFDVASNGTMKSILTRVNMKASISCITA